MSNVREYTTDGEVVATEIATATGMVEVLVLDDGVRVGLKAPDPAISWSAVKLTIDEAEALAHALDRATT